MKAVHFQVDTTTALMYLLKMEGGYWKEGTSGPCQGYMGLYLEEWDYDYSRISAKLLKRGGRLTVKEPQGQFRVETFSSNTSLNFLNKRNSRYIRMLPKYTDAMQCNLLGEANIFMHSHLSQ